MNFVDELTWRGMVHDMMPGTREQLESGMTAAYVGIDPTANSLHIGHLVSVMMLRHLQRAGHKPVALIGGATGMIGDPSMKSAERNLLDEETLRHNQYCIKKQLAKFLDFDSNAPNAARLVNNYDWMKDYSFLDFIRDIGKHLTVNYMMAKDSVRKRLGADSDAGLSFTEFSYQLLQGYDFLHLYQHEGVRLQMGGSDQWGNITTGTELIRRKLGADARAYALVCPLITKADGSKFGKTESGNVWLDPQLTSPYAFYQFWLNTSDDDAGKYLRIFTLLGKKEIEELTASHSEAPHLRLLQRRLAEELTLMVHSKEELETAKEASRILFGDGTADTLRKLDESDFLSVFEGVPRYEIKRSTFEEGINIVDLLSDKTGIFPSKAEVRRAINGNGLSINKEKVSTTDLIVNTEFLTGGKYIVAQKGKKNYFLIIAG